jgi:hypothetical protein
MLLRTLVVGLIALAVATSAVGATAVSGKIVVTPGSPVVGTRAKIMVQVTVTSAEKAPAVLYVKATSPRGASLRVQLSRVKVGSWKTAFVFADRGQWRLSVVAGKGGTPKAGSVLGASSVLVRA